MKANITLEDALKKARPGLRYRIEQSKSILLNKNCTILIFDAYFCCAKVAVGIA